MNDGLFPESSRHQPRLVQRAHALVAAIERDGLMDERAALLCELLIRQAEVLSTTTKAYAFAPLAGDMRETIEALPVAVEGDAWSQLEAALAAEVQA